MAAVAVWKWVVKPEKQEAHNPMMHGYPKWIKENPIKEVKSMTVFIHTFGGIYGSYFELLAFDSLSDYDKAQAKLLRDKEFKEILQELMLVSEPAELHIDVWSTVM